METMLHSWWPQIVGYVFAVIIAHFPIRLVVDQMWKDMGWTEKNQDETRPHSWHPRILGCVERTLYVASYQLGKPEFIGVWLALKVAGQWKRWGQEPGSGATIIAGRHVYNVFLIGSALSIAYGITGAKMVEWFVRGNWTSAIGVPLILVIASLAIWSWTTRYHTATEKETRQER
jgi:hypothetical protein